MWLETDGDKLVNASHLRRLYVVRRSVNGVWAASGTDVLIWLFDTEGEASRAFETLGQRLADGELRVIRRRDVTYLE